MSAHMTIKARNPDLARTALTVSLLLALTAERIGEIGIQGFERCEEHPFQAIVHLSGPSR